MRHNSSIDACTLAPMSPAETKPFEEGKQYFIRALAFMAEAKWGDAERALKSSLELVPGRASTLTNLFAVLIKQGKLDEAEGVLRELRAVSGETAETLLNRGILAHERKDFAAALATLDASIARNPSCAEAWCSRGVALHNLRRFDEALDSVGRAIEINPELADAWYNRANSLRGANDHEEALLSYSRAIELKRDYAEAWKNRSITLSELGRFAEAAEGFAQTLAHDPNSEFVFGNLIHTRMKLCDWDGLNEHVDELKRQVSGGRAASPPFAILALVDDPELQKESARIFARARYRGSNKLGPIAPRSRSRKVRLGYFSMDFRDHPVSHLAVALFEQHDRTRFEVLAFSFGPRTGDAMNQRVSRAFDDFIDVQDVADVDIARMAREREIDIAIDLAGYTQDARAGIFAERAAPVQVNYLGYPGTMGAEFMDYLIADSVLVPEAHRRFYTEKIAYLPSNQPNDAERLVAPRTFTREECGLPSVGFVYCCFNHAYKIVPAIFEGWMRILRQVEGSVLWLAEADPSAMSNLRKEALRRGVDAERLIFAKKTPRIEQHLARLRVADLFLDTLPYNAHATASDALWVGVPVLTRLGEAFPGRVAASLLTTLELPELVVSTQEAYESNAIELATVPEKLSRLKQRLAANRATSPLFDTRSYAAHIEALYMQIYERYQAGLPPDHLYSAR